MLGIHRGVFALTVCSAIYAGARLSIGHPHDRLVWQPAAEPARLRRGTGA